ncbi:Small RNA 2'-O-methyltransferase [Symbiodinium microadriaticum]|uniref:Small RNA 2'-O-methyltransferase n=1 Tax=Symbiodinium microadriaticum TaxID=2951 RepID=A0A1Q9CNC5_SYMMI|nr:Small RNA 2'-O-methyltransferase [Symbiodinium microadriaticum]
MEPPPEPAKTIKFDPPLWKQRQRYIVQALQVSSVLDLGCGDGQLLEALVAVGLQRVLGLDLSESRIKAASRRLAEKGGQEQHVEVMQADFVNVPAEGEPRWISFAAGVQAIVLCEDDACAESYSYTSTSAPPSPDCLKKKFDKKLGDINLAEFPTSESEPVETAAHAASAPSEPSIDRSATEALLQELKPLLVPATASPELLRETFEKYGVCVVTGVLSAKECSLMEQIWLQDLLQILDDAKIPDDGVAGQVRALKAKGLQEWPKEWDVPTYGLPHGSFAWAARLHPTVRRVFADLFETPAEELAVGLDLPFFASSGQPGMAACGPKPLHRDDLDLRRWTVLAVFPSSFYESRYLKN